MFYEERSEPILRFGDVITNIVEHVPVLNKLPHDNEYQIDIKNTKYFVVTSPCCSIEDEMLSVSPMRPVLQKLFDNEYFRDDFTRLNLPIDPQNSIPKKAWDKMDVDKQRQFLEKGKTYSFIELFAYQGNECFDEYKITTREREVFSSRYYLIDFRNIFYFRSKEVRRGNDFSAIKLIQLSIDTRKELRDKLTNYFARVPEEDRK